MYMSWEKLLKLFGKIGENIDMTYMCWYSIKTPLKPNAKNIRRKWYGISLIANLYEEKPQKENS